MRIPSLVLTGAALFGCGFLVWSDVIAYTYDDAGRLVRVDYGAGKTISYTYDKSGNLLRRTVTTESAGAEAPVAQKKPLAKSARKTTRQRRN
jgi:YD repeat-containing protein